MATMKNKSIGFNVEKDAEKHMFDYCEKMPNFARYVKGLIWNDLQARKMMASGQQMQKPPHNGAVIK